MIILRYTIKRLRANSAGFTLLEAMISLAVFTVGILGMAAMQTHAIRNNTKAEDIQQNTVGAMAQIEELMATDFLDWRISDDNTTCYWTSDGKYNICVQRQDDGYIPGCKRVIVTSTFTPKDGLSESVVLHIFKPDIDRITP